MSEGHDHGTGEVKHAKPLWWALGLTSTFLVAEIIGGLVTNSLALLSDAAHMMTDVIALTVSLIAVRMSQRPADTKRTYGYARMEAIGAIINGGLLFVVAGYILWEAVGRFRQPPDVASTGMLVIAVKTMGLTKYKLSEKGRDLVCAASMEREMARVPASSRVTPSFPARKFCPTSAKAVMSISGTWKLSVTELSSSSMTPALNTMSASLPDIRAIPRLLLR